MVVQVKFVSWMFSVIVKYIDLTFCLYIFVDNSDVHKHKQVLVTGRTPRSVSAKVVIIKMQSQSKICSLGNRERKNMHTS